MYSKSKLAVLTVSALVVFYAALVMFYGKVVAQENDAYKGIAVFVDVLDKINTEYVDVPDLTKVMAGAMKGMVESLDPYGGYFGKEQYKELDRRIKESRGDIGVVLSKKPELVYVVSRIAGSPAEKAGIRPGDYIVSVDGQSTFTLHLREVEAALKGEPGTEIRLKVLRGSQAEPIEITLKREVIRYPEIQQEILADHIGYLHPYFLGDQSAKHFKAKLKTLQAAGAKEILLDLRYVAGGDFSQALEIANFFIRDGLLSYTEGKQRPRKDYQASGVQFICDLPLVTLLNSATAGPAEVIAGAIKDRGRGELVGEKSFGTGSHQEPVDLRDGSILLLTTERYFTPSGKAIQTETAQSAGITPDVVSPDANLKSDLLLQNYLDNRVEDSNDNFLKLMKKIDAIQMRKALELLNTKEGASRKAA